jgi:hypothetical protein
VGHRAAIDEAAAERRPLPFVDESPRRAACGRFCEWLAQAREELGESA